MHIGGITHPTNSMTKYVRPVSSNFPTVGTIPDEQHTHPFSSCISLRRRRPNRRAPEQRPHPQGRQEVPLLPESSLR